MNDNINLTNVITELEMKGFDFVDQRISYFSYIDEIFVFAGKYPLCKEVLIPLKEFKK